MRKNLSARNPDLHPLRNGLALPPDLVQQSSLLLLRRGGEPEDRSLSQLPDPLLERELLRCLLLSLEQSLWFLGKDSENNSLISFRISFDPSYKVSPRIFPQMGQVLSPASSGPS
ncbi:UNVERIFIED_CONTAM: hypothetical protein K2H54_051664 [Gekko kuhli]